MFRKGGMGELYLYAPREKQVDSLCTLPPLSFCNSVYGMSIGRGSWTFKTGEWTDIRQDIWLNTPGKADGGFNIWCVTHSLLSSRALSDELSRRRINGRIALRSDTVYYRNSVSGLVSNGTSTGDIATLINYDSIPDDVVIPNGGFKDYPAGNTSAPVSSGVFQPTFVTKILNPTATSALPTTTPPVPYRFDNENRRLRRTVVELEAKKEKRATVATIPGFLGAMAQTFFGGSTSDYVSSPCLLSSEPRLTFSSPTELARPPVLLLPRLRSADQLIPRLLLALSLIETCCTWPAERAFLLIDTNTCILPSSLGRTQSVASLMPLCCQSILSHPSKPLRCVSERAIASFRLLSNDDLFVWP